MLLASVVCWLLLKAPIQYVLVEQSVIADQGSDNKGAFSLRAQAAQRLLRLAALAHGPSMRRCALAVSLLPLCAPHPSALYLHDGELQPCRLDCCAVSVCAGTGGPLFTVCRRLYTPVWRKAAQSTGIHSTKNRMSTISFCKRNAQQQAIKEQREGVQPFSGLKSVLSASQSSLQLHTRQHAHSHGKHKSWIFRSILPAQSYLQNMKSQLPACRQV
jgi:hypothetical protein